LLKRFDQVTIEHVPRIENQEANDLAQIASGYKISNEKLEELIEIKDKLIIDQPAPLELSMPKLVGADVPQDNDQDTTYDCDFCDVCAVFGKRAEVERMRIFKTAISSFCIRRAVELAFLRGQFVSLYFRQALMNWNEMMKSHLMYIIAF
jgi:hypothetical protein